MKYILAKSNVSQEEIKERMEYIYDIFHIYTLKDNTFSNENITVLKSIPENCIDLLMIIGHDRSTDKFLIDNYRKIKESNIAIIACNTCKFLSLQYLKGKQVYLPQKGGIISCYDGRYYGFPFDVTDEEILLYRNRNENLDEMLKKAFKEK